MPLRIRVVLSALSLFFSGLLLAAPVGAQAPTVGDMAQELVCQCGCNAVLSNCLHESCPVRDSMMAELRPLVSQGKSREEVLSYFVARYGEPVLSAPPKQGFNLTAWLLPFLALAVGAVAVYALLRGWVRPREAPVPEPIPPEGLEQYEERLKRDLEQRRSLGGL